MDKIFGELEGLSFPLCSIPATQGHIAKHSQKKNECFNHYPSAITRATSA